MSTRSLVFLAVALATTGLLTLSTTLKGSVSKDLAPAESNHLHTLDLNDNNTITIFDEISGANSEAVAGAINNLNRLGNGSPIYLLLDSPGGSVIAGSKVIAAIEASKRPVYTACVTICASMAAMIHSYGKKRLMMKGSILMFHNASGHVEGEFPRMVSLLTTLGRYVEKMDENVVSRSKLSKEKFMSLANNEFYIDGDDAVAYGLADQVVFIDVTTLKLGRTFEEKKQDATTKPVTKFDIRL